ncbi:MAG: hypothetical protein KDE09_09245 [Anaerolineales bacterium]|nr:hypothetical protein [Anaerolineales bacterium]MCB0028925.1 hypothetical protein [Anaerolineales bacterium]
MNYISSKMLPKYARTILTCLILMACVACSPNDLELAEIATETATIYVGPPNEIPSMEPSQTANPPTSTALQPTDTPGATPSPTFTVTSTAVTTATVTLQRIWETTLTPIPGFQVSPTIAPEMREEYFLELMQSNGGCALPCWWGVEVGQSTMGQVRQLYERFDPHIVGTTWENGISSAIEITLDYVDSEHGSLHSYAAVDDVVSSIYIDAGRTPQYQIGSVLAQLGAPSETWIWTYPEPAFDGQITMSFVMFFPQKGTIAYYELPVVRQDDNVEACFDTEGLSIFYFWLPEELNPFGELSLKELVHPNSIFNVELSHPIQDVSNWDVNQFYSTLVDPNHTDCLETPADIWPSRY